MKRKNNPKPDHYPVLVVSDTHLGMGNSSTDLLVEFLQNVTCDRLILNGDIIDGWRMNMHKPEEFSEAQLRVVPPPIFRCFPLFNGGILWEKRAASSPVF